MKVYLTNKYIYDLALIILSVLTLILNLYSQYASGQTFRKFHNYDVNETCYIITDSAKIRSETNSRSDMLDQLNIGQKVIIKEATNQTQEIGGYEGMWYNVTYRLNGKKKTGYVWGGLLSAMTAPLNDSLNVLYGLHSVNKHGYSYINIQVYVIQGNTILDSVIIKSDATVYTACGIEVNGQMGVIGINNIINILFSDSFCGGFFGYTVLFWDGKNLHHAVDIQEGADSPYFMDVKLIYPDDRSGEPGIIKYESISGYHSDEGTDIIEDRSSKEYKWNGTILIEIN